MSTSQAFQYLANSSDMGKRRRCGCRTANTVRTTTFTISTDTKARRNTAASVSSVPRPGVVHRAAAPPAMAASSTTPTSMASAPTIAPARRYSTRMDAGAPRVGEAMDSAPCSATQRSMRV